METAGLQNFKRIKHPSCKEKASVDAVFFALKAPFDAMVHDIHDTRLPSTPKYKFTPQPNDRKQNPEDHVM